jgi:hypothetical protein
MTSSLSFFATSYTSYTKKYDISETNIAGIGTPLDKAIREAAAGK